MSEKKTEERIMLHMTSAQRHRIDDWRRRQPDLPGMSEAIRRLIDAALDTAERRPQKRGQ